MNSEDNYIISAEQYEKYDDKHENRRWKELLEEKIANGEITKNSIWRSMCDSFSLEYCSKLDALKQEFKALSDLTAVPRSFISEASFVSSLRTDLQLPDHGVSVLFQILRAHATFPFPASELGLTINVDDFARSVRVLCDPEHLDCGIERGGAWGPYNGSIHIGRTRSTRDARRLLFRALSSPLDSHCGSLEDDTKDPTIQVTAFSYFLADPSGDDNSALQEIRVVQDEDERHVDVLDVLSNFLGPPRWLSAPPSRRVYTDVLSNLPLSRFTLNQLQVARIELEELLRLSVWKVSLKWSLDVNTLDDLVEILLTAFGKEPQVSWKTFDLVFVNSLSNFLSASSSFFRLSHIVETIAGVRFGLPKIPEVFDSDLPPLTRYPLCLQLATFLPRTTELQKFRLVKDEVPLLNTILQTFDNFERSVLLLVSATPAAETTEANASLDSSLIFGVFSNAALGQFEDTESGSNLDQSTQIFQLQPIHCVFSAQSFEMRLSCDRERPQKSGMIFEGLMRGGRSVEMERTSLMFMGKDKEGKLERARDILKFKVDNWWLLVETN